jgi:hypothetical protein
VNVDPESFCRRFSSTLIAAYDLLRGEQTHPRLARRQDSAIIFAALEDCRDLCATWAGLTVNEVWCRYTLGKPDDENKRKLRDILNKLRRINPSLDDAPGHLSEFAFDFSISSMRIDEGYSANGPTLARPFQFIVIAESELAHSIDEVAKDMLRLGAACSPLKVLVYNHWGVDLRPRLTQVLTRCTTNDALDTHEGPQRRLDRQ